MLHHSRIIPAHSFYHIWAKCLGFLALATVIKFKKKGKFACYRISHILKYATLLCYVDAYMEPSFCSNLDRTATWTRFTFGNVAMTRVMAILQPPVATETPLVHTVD